MDKDFREIGLTDVESRVYLRLLELRKATTGSIAKKSGIHRRTVYDALERLTIKGLVSYIKENNRRYFTPANPERLLEILDEGRDKLKEKIVTLQPQYSLVQELEETVFFRGKQGLKTVFDDQVRTGKDILVLGGSKNAEDVLQYYFTRYNKLRAEKKVKLKIIFACKRLKKRFPLTSLRYLPEEYNTEVATNIYGDKVAIIHWAKLFVILIKNKDIAQTYKNYFDILWEKAKE
ncbi:TrmB family transcriptional regulator [Candidatus Woesearchaeota archaeon]|nr:TrmB family transcriptional regulator [Candidatus Woesearchaeota archaeon]